MVREIKAMLVGAVAAWAAVGLFGNVSDWSGTTYAVAEVTSMEKFDFGSADWRATRSPTIVTMGALLIVTFKALTAILCAIGAWRMWTARDADRLKFQNAKELAFVGCAVAVFGLFVGWIVLAESWWEIWRSSGLISASQGAFRYAGFIGLIALIVATPEDWDHRSAEAS